MAFEIDLTGRVALVTGGSRNIGREIALRLASAGAAVAVTWSHDDAGAKEVCTELDKIGVANAAVQIHLEDPESIAAGVDSIVAALGRVDILVNNAATRQRAAVSAVTLPQWDSVFAVNVRAPFLLSQHVLPSMLSGGWGRIVCIGGLSAYEGANENVLTTTTKLALVGLARSLALDVSRLGVTVNVIVPGKMDTIRANPDAGIRADDYQSLRRIPAGRLGDPAEVADACVFLCSDRAGYTTGQELFVTGGLFPLAPAVRDRD